MPRLVDFIPLCQETVSQIRARMDADANAGVDPSSADFLDLQEGGPYYDLTQIVAAEISRLYALAGAETPAAMFASYAWGTYLDDHAEELGVERKAASYAEGIVRFTGTEGAAVSEGTEVSTVVATATDEELVFSTTESGTISGGFVDLQVIAEQPGAQANVGVGTISEMVSANSGVNTVTNQAATTGGTDVETDEDLRVRVLLALKGASGAGTSTDYERWALAYSGVTSAVVEPVWAGAGTVRVVLTGSDQGPVTDTVKFGLQDELDPPTYVSVTTGVVDLPLATINVESTVGANSSGTFRLGTEVVTYSGKTDTSFTGCSGGTGAYAPGSRVSDGFGLGGGKAPIGAIVTVDTVTSVAINVVATVTHADGYSLTGAGGTVATTTDLTDALTRYLNALSAGSDVVLNHVIAQFFQVDGVVDVSSVTLNGSASNVVIAALETARIGTVTLS